MSEIDSSDTVPTKSKKYSIAKWFILILSYSFLIYKLVSFDKYTIMADWWRNVPASYLPWLMAVLVLLPLNLLLESIKWQMLVMKIEKLSIKDSFNSILTGITTGFFTPNRVGDFLGRLLYLQPKNRIAGVALSVLNSLLQNSIMAIFGIPAFVIFLLTQNKLITPRIYQYLISIIFLVVLFILSLYFLKRALKHAYKWKIVKRLKKYLDRLTEFSMADIYQIMMVTTFRYLVFCVQFFFMLRFFGVDLTVFQALFAIPATYLLVTYTPSLGISEAAVRSSYAVLIIGAITPQEVQIILAGISIWLVNFVIPMLMGSVILIKKKEVLLEKQH